jgi:hypothetical protein
MNEIDRWHISAGMFNMLQDAPDDNSSKLEDEQARLGRRPEQILIPN